MDKRDYRPFKITEVFAFIAVDPTDGDEGVMAFYSEDMGGMMPMIGADPKRVESLTIKAEEIKVNHAIDYTIKRFKLVET
jgi:hypothetical protein